MRFQNVAGLTISMQGAQFALILNNVFKLQVNAVGIDITLMNAQAG